MDITGTEYASVEGPGPAPDEERVAFAGVAGQLALLERGELTSRALVELTLRRIAAADHELNAFRVVQPQAALAAADAADLARARGEHRPLLGVPVAVKDDTDAAGLRTTHGTGVRPHPARADADVVARLRAAGAVVVGKTRMPEFGQWAFTETAGGGHTRNPWDLGRTTGGSSGGSAAAVAAGLVPAATGTDGGGSIRIPAAYCGLFGLKVQRGRLSAHPRSADWSRLAVVGALTRTVEDSAALYDAVAGTAFRDGLRDGPGPLRIGVAVRPTVPGVRLDAEQEAALWATADALADLGHQVRQVHPRYPEFLSVWVVQALRAMHGDATAMLTAAPHPDPLALVEQRTRENLATARRLPASVSGWADRRAGRITAAVTGLFSRMDVLLTPTVAELPRPLGALDGVRAQRASLRSLPSIAYTALWNLTGQPAAAVPAGLSRAGLPLSVQVVGRPHAEATVLQVSAQLERLRPWAGLRPAAPPVG